MLHAVAIVVIAFLAFAVVVAFVSPFVAADAQRREAEQQRERIELEQRLMRERTRMIFADRDSRDDGHSRR